MAFFNSWIATSRAQSATQYQQYKRERARWCSYRVHPYMAMATLDTPALAMMLNQQTLLLYE